MTSRSRDRPWAGLPKPKKGIHTYMASRAKVDANLNTRRAMAIGRCRDQAHLHQCTDAGSRSQPATFRHFPPRVRGLPRMEALFANSIEVMGWEKREACFGGGAREWRAPTRAPPQIDGFVHYVFCPFFAALGGRSAIPWVRGLPWAAAATPQRHEESLRPFGMLRAGGAKGDNGWATMGAKNPFAERRATMGGRQWARRIPSPVRHAQGRRSEGRQWAVDNARRRAGCGRGMGMDTQGVALDTQGVASGLCCFGLSGRMADRAGGWDRSGPREGSFHSLGRAIMESNWRRYPFWLLWFPCCFEAFWPAIGPGQDSKRNGTFLGPRVPCSSILFHSLLFMWKIRRACAIAMGSSG